jgi:hypothetical protein
LHQPFCKGECWQIATLKAELSPTRVRKLAVATTLNSAFAQLAFPTYRHGLMGQQHRVRTKRKRRRAYLQRKKDTVKAARQAPKGRAKKQAAAAE